MQPENSASNFVTLGHADEVLVSVRAIDKTIGATTPHYFRCEKASNEKLKGIASNEPMAFKNWRCSATFTKDTHHVFGIAASGQTNLYHFVEVDTDSDGFSNEPTQPSTQSKMVVRLSTPKPLPEDRRFNGRDKRLFIYKKSNHADIMYLEHAALRKALSICDKNIILGSSAQSAAGAKIVHAQP